MLNYQQLFHPQFYYAHRPIVNSAQVAQVIIYKPTGNITEWVPGADEFGDDLYVKVWEGHARVQPNKDWRARPKEAAGDFDVTHAVRVQIPIGENLVGSTFDPVDGRRIYGVDPVFAKDFRVDVMVSPVKGTERLVGDQFIVRNASISSNAWVHNLLCDTGTKK